MRISLSSDQVSYAGTVSSDLIGGGDITWAELFVNNSTGRIGLVGYWDSVAFDEFAGKGRRPKGDIVDILKNYMANKSLSRGIEQVTAEAPLAFAGNTGHDMSYMIRKTDLFEDLPAVYHALELSPAAAKEQGATGQGTHADAVCDPQAVTPVQPAVTDESVVEEPLFERARHYRENQRGVSYDLLFGDYIEGAHRVKIVDPHIRAFHQCRNLMDLLMACP